MDDLPLQRSAKLIRSEAAHIDLWRLDSIDTEFQPKFEPYRTEFLAVLSQSHTDYFGDAYHVNRILGGRAILYFAIDAGAVVGASYVKRNLRRGGTSVHPPAYRRFGIAQSLVSASFEDFPEQYSILDPSNLAMVRLLQKCGFKRAATAAEVESIVGVDFQQLSGLVESPEGIVFARHSQTRDSRRGLLTLFYRRPNAGATR